MNSKKLSEIAFAAIAKEVAAMVENYQSQLDLSSVENKRLLEDKKILESDLESALVELEQSTAVLEELGSKDDEGATLLESLRAEKASLEAENRKLVQENVKAKKFAKDAEERLETREKFHEDRYSSIEKKMNAAKREAAELKAQL